MKTAIVYIFVSVLCILVDYLYSLFGHGVASASMVLMFLYPLVGGTIVYLFVWLLVPEADTVQGYRMCYNLYNSGIATLIIGSMLHGVLEIAGTSSPYTVVFMLAGGVLAGIGAIGFIWNVRQYRKHQRQAHRWNRKLDDFFDKDPVQEGATWNPNP